MGPYIYFRVLFFHYFGFIHAKNVIFAGIGFGLHCWQILIFTYAYALIFIHRHFGSLFWLLGVLIGSLFHKIWVLIGSLSQSLGVFISFRGSGYGTLALSWFCSTGDMGPDEPQLRKKRKNYLSRLARKFELISESCIFKQDFLCFLFFTVPKMCNIRINIY